MSRSNNRAPLAAAAAMTLLFSLPGMSQEGTPGLKLSERWVFVSHNFMVEKNVADTIAVLQRAAKAGYNGILLTDCKGIVPWLKDAAKVKGVIGVVYTTWARNFGELERFKQIVDEFRPPAPR